MSIFSKLFKPKQKELDTDKCIDINGKIYKSVKIGEQEWMVANLNICTFRNGDTISEAKSVEDWIRATIEKKPAWCFYENDPKNGKIYGKLYNWYAVNDPRGLAPKGWHVPNDDEWKQLEMYLGMSRSEANDRGNRGTNEGSKLAGKANLWDNGELKNNTAFGESRLSALPGGIRNYDYGAFHVMGVCAYFWSSTEHDRDTAWDRSLYYYHSEVTRYEIGKGSGFSVRCVRD